MLFTERSETSKERVNLNVSDNSKGRDRISSAWLVDTSNTQRAFFSIFMLQKYCRSHQKQDITNYRQLLGEREEEVGARGDERTKERGGGDTRGEV